MRKPHFWREAGGWLIVPPFFVNGKEPTVLQKGTKGAPQGMVTPPYPGPHPSHLQVGVQGAHPPRAYRATALNGGSGGAGPAEQEGEEKGKWLWAGGGVESRPGAPRLPGSFPQTQALVGARHGPCLARAHPLLN